LKLLDLEFANSIVGGDGWWSFRMPTLFDPLHQLLRDFFFGLGD
jgi:hypothetical protein